MSSIISKLIPNYRKHFFWFCYDFIFTWPRVWIYHLLFRVIMKSCLSEVLKCWSIILICEIWLVAWSFLPPVLRFSDFPRNNSSSDVECRVSERLLPAIFEQVKPVIWSLRARAWSWVSVFDFFWRLVILISFNWAEYFELIPPTFSSLLHFKDELRVH